MIFTSVVRNHNWIEICIHKFCEICVKVCVISFACVHACSTLVVCVFNIIWFSLRGNDEIFPMKLCERNDFILGVLFLLLLFVLMCGFVVFAPINCRKLFSLSRTLSLHFNYVSIYMTECQIRLQAHTFEVVLLISERHSKLVTISSTFWVWHHLLRIYSNLCNIENLTNEAICKVPDKQYCLYSQEINVIPLDILMNLSVYVTTWE